MLLSFDLNKSVLLCIGSLLTEVYFNGEIRGYLYKIILDLATNQNGTSKRGKTKIETNIILIIKSNIVEKI